MTCSKTFPMPLAIALCAALGLSTAAEANIVLVEPGTSCKPRQAQESFYRYDPPALKNVSSSAWDLVSAICPLSQHVGGKRLDAARVVIKDPSRRTTWCGFYDLEGRETAFRWSGSWNSQNVTVFTFSRAALGASVGQSFLSGTFVCPLQNGASLERIEVVFLD